VLTIKMLEAMPPHTIFARGTFRDSPTEVNHLNSGKFRRWIAKRGAIPDWAIYIGEDTWSWDEIASNDDKLFTPRYIKYLVHCDDESLAMYRQ